VSNDYRPGPHENVARAPVNGTVFANFESEEQVAKFIALLAAAVDDRHLPVRVPVEIFNTTDGAWYQLPPLCIRFPGSEWALQPKRNGPN